MRWTFENAKIKGRIVLTDSLHEDPDLLKDKTLYKFIWVDSFQDDVGIAEGRSQFDFAHQESRGRRVRLPDIDDRMFSGPENGSLRHDDPVLIALKGGIDLGGRIHFRF